MKGDTVMCNWIVTGKEGDKSTVSRPIETEQEAKNIAASWVTIGTKDVVVWERKYSVKSETTVTLELPNGRQERLEVKADESNG